VTDLDRARQRLAQGDLAGAERECAALIAGPAPAADQAAAHLIVSTCRQRQRDYDTALTHVRVAQTLVPRDAIAWYAQAEIQDAMGDRPGAIVALASALARNPSFAHAHHLLGILLAERGDNEGALAEFETTVHLDPRHARGYNNLGNMLRNLQRMDEARRAFERAVEIDPGYILAVANLAAVIRDQGRPQDAERMLREHLARFPDRPPSRSICTLLGGILQDHGQLEEAARWFARAVELAPKDSAAEWVQLARIQSELDQLDAARGFYAHAERSGDLRGTIGRRLVLPLVYRDASDLETMRACYAEALTELESIAHEVTGGRKPEDILDGLRWSNFFLAYQGRDDRELQAQYGSFVAKAIDTVAPQWRQMPTSRRASRSRLRIGFASAYLRDSTAGRYFQRWITDLDAKDFEVFVYHLFPATDAVSASIAQRADVFRAFSSVRSRPSVIAPIIRGDDLDVLVYPELGMDPTTFALAALRLAPRQYAGWGHPVTPGHATIDGYFTAETMEPDNATAHYNEPLIMLPGIGTRYVRPPVPGDGTRASLGLPDDVPLLLCPQSLFKIHPDNDALFAKVLAANPRARLVIFAWRAKPVTTKYLKRMASEFEQSGIDARSRLIVLDPMPHADFMRVNRACDAMLDTLHWSGGNTSLDALACGLPIVTLPGAYMRGRQSTAMLRLMGQEALIARDPADYVNIVTRLVEDAGWRNGSRLALIDAQRQVFDDSAPVSRIAQFLLDAPASPR